MAELSSTTMNQLPLVLKASDIRQVLGLSWPKTYQLLTQAGFPLVRIGRCYRVPRDQFFQWLTGQAGRR